MKKRGWEFNYRFQTWIKREVIKETVNGRTLEKARTFYFDFENEWKVKTSSTTETSQEDAKFSQYIERDLVP